MTNPMESYEDSGVETPHVEIHLADYWAVVVKYRRLMLAILFVALAVAVVATVIAKPVYRASAVIDIVRQQGNPLGISDSTWASASNDAEFLPSQIELMKSRGVAERVVESLSLLSDREFNPSATGRPSGAAPAPASLAAAARRVQADANAVIVRGTSLVKVSFDAPSAALAARIANGIVDAYVAWNIESRFRQIGQSAEYLAGQIEQTKRDLEAKEKALLVYARQKDLPIDGKVDSTSRLDSFHQDYAMAVADRVAKEARYQELQNTSPETIAETAPGSQVAQIRGEIARLEQDYKEKLTVYKPEWPAMQQLKRQIDEGPERLRVAVQESAAKAREAARSDYLMAQRREASLQEMLRTQQTQALNQGASGGDYKNLRVEIDTKRALLDGLLKQQGEAEVLSRMREQQLTNVRIVDRALPPGGPFKPSLPRNLIIAFVLGSVAAFGTAFLLSYLDRSLRSTDQVERYLDLPALGAIPYLANAPSSAWQKALKGVAAPVATAPSGARIEMMPHAEPRSAIAEAYRSFRSSLLFSRAGGVRVVAITSVLPQEGKSATAVNLAVVLSQLGRRVLLVDADLHRSRIHGLLGVSNRTGLVSILAEGTEPSRVIVKTDIPGVFVVPAGPETPNPSGLLSSDAMQRFLELAATNFDHVIVDTPPVLATSDVLVFGQYTDGVVLCVRAGKTPRDQVRRVRDKLLRAGLTILGVLLSGLELDSSYYGGHEYRYLNYGERAKNVDASKDNSPKAAGAG